MPKAVMHLEDLVDDASYRSFTASQAGHGKSLTSRLALPNSRDVETGEHQAFVGCVIALKNLSYAVDSSSTPVVLLHNITGCLEAGQMTALMGPSGAGKSTLLDVLSGRKTAGTASGEVTYGGRVASRAFLRRYTAYVEQHELLIGCLTVAEHLMYQAEMKRPLDESRLRKAEVVENILTALGLAPCRHVKVCCISGGQAKRVNIGLALVLNPRVLFLDEPTSGLDTFTANETVAYIKLLASEAVTIVSTIHSPSATAFELFDNLVLLARGHVTYFGLRGDAMAFAKAEWPLKFEVHCEDPAEWLISALTRADRAEASPALAEAYALSQLAADNAACALTWCSTVLSSFPPHIEKELAVSKATFLPPWAAFCTLVRYRVAADYANKRFLAPRVFGPVLSALCCASPQRESVESATRERCRSLSFLFPADAHPYSGGPHRVAVFQRGWARGGVASQSAVLYDWTILPLFAGVAFVAPVIMERGLYLREVADGLYSPATYLAYKLFSELALSTVLSVPIAAAVFYSASLQGSFVFFWLVYVGQIWLGLAMAYATALSLAAVDTACLVLTTFITACLWLSGFIIPFYSIPVYWRWFTYINPVHYIWTCLMINQFEGTNGDPVMDGGSTVMRHYGFKGFTEGGAYSWFTININKWACFGFTWLIIAFFISLAWCQLRYRTHVVR